MINFKYKIFGRFKGRKKRNENRNSNLNKYNFVLEQINKELDYNILDIGSGSGENAICLSNSQPNSQIITCEIFEDGNINLSNYLQANQVQNISMFKGNVLEFLDDLNFQLLFNEIWILFPDPWPKVRHQKRRLISKDFLEKIYPYLTDNGNLMIASDSKSYIHSISNIIYEVRKSYRWVNQSYDLWNYSNLDLPETKFYKKAVKNGRNTMFFKLNKI
jgi:tRNA (guanine-N7-)-methyltransferase